MFFNFNTLFINIPTADDFSGRGCRVTVSFLFNWMGLLATLCLSETVAGRLGAIAGFGLSIIKWAAILKVYTYTDVSYFV